MTLIPGIESSCDETAVALVASDRRLLAQRVARVTDGLDAPARARRPLDPEAERVCGAGVKA